MKNKEILEKAIKRAVDNGWEFWGQGQGPFKVWNAQGANNFEIEYESGSRTIFGSYYDVIFSHDFAKAFWKSGTHYYKNGSFNYKPENWWKDNLQQMVLEEEPLKYLERYLDEKM